MTIEVPKVFLSYSHDSAEHKQWVLDLATRLVNGGIDVRIDAWSLGAGDDLPHFMETQLSEVDRVVMICTSNYVNKANKGTGGVGYEKMIITSSLMSRIDDNKVIPIIRQQSTNDVPTFLKSKLYIDFSNDSEFESVIDDLMRAVHNSPLYTKPDLGSNPYQTAESKPAESKTNKQIMLLKLMVERYELGFSEFSFEELYQMIDSSRLFAEIHVQSLLDKKLITSSYQTNYITGSCTVYKLTSNAKMMAIKFGWVTE
jgi:hypothetical protein